MEGTREDIVRFLNRIFDCAEVVDLDLKKSKKAIKENVLSVLMSEAEWLQTKKDVKVNWAGIFFFMAQESESAIPLRDMLELGNTIQSCIEYSKNKSYLPFLIDLQTYVKYHCVDGGNTLLGLQPNDELFSKYYGKTSTGEYQLLTKMQMPSDVNQVNKKKGFFRWKVGTVGVEKMFSRGQIAIYFKHGVFIPSSAIFVRIVESVPLDKTIAAIHTESLEMIDRHVKVNHLLPIPDELLEDISIMPLRDHIQDPINEWHISMNRSISLLTKEFLLEHGIQTEDLNYLTALLSVPLIEPTQLSYLPLCRDMKEKFSAIEGTKAVDDFFTAVIAFGKTEVNKCKTNQLLMEKAFGPSRKCQLQELELKHYDDIPKNKLNKYFRGCNEILSKLEEQRTAILEGKLKLELSSWWLDKILEEHQRFVEERGIDLSAIPDNYIDQAPDDIEAVRKNLDIVESIFKEFRTESKDGAFHSWIAAQTEEIYSRISCYYRACLMVLAQFLEIKHSSTNISDLESLEGAIKEKGSLPKNISNLIKDIQYVEEMKSMEECMENTSVAGALAMSNVVPISGLIVGSFYRLENILRTILEIYDNPHQPSLSFRAISNEIIQATKDQNWDLVISLAESAKRIANATAVEPNTPEEES